MNALSQFPRNRITVAAWMAEMDRQRGARIRQLRDGIPMARERFAHELGVTVKTVYNWEQGKEINPENLRAIAKYFDVTVDFIRSGPLETPDLLAHSDEVVVGKLDEIIDQQREFLSRIDALEAQLALWVPAQAADTPPAKAGKSRTTAKKPAKQRSSG